VTNTLIFVPTLYDVAITDSHSIMGVAPDGDLLDARFEHA